MNAPRSKPIPSSKSGKTSKSSSSEASPSEAQQLFYQVVHSIPSAILLTRLSDGLIADANPAFLKLTGYSLDELVGLTSTQAGVVLDPKAREERLAALKDNIPVPDFEVSLTTKSGDVREGLATVGKISMGGEIFALTTFVDITYRNRVERQVLQMKRLYATLSQVNQTIVRVKTRDDLYQSICDVAVEVGEFSLAWIGLLDAASGEIRPIAANGLDVANWPFPIVNIHKGDGKDGLAAIAMRTTRVATSENIQTDERMQKQHDQLRDFAYHSSAAVPFRFQGKTIGILGLVSSDDGLFKGKDEIRLLKEMGMDISFALETMEIEAARQQAEQQVLQMKRLYATLSQVNQMIVRVHSRDDLFQSICNVAVEFGKFSLAWISLLDEDTKDVKPVVANGVDLSQWPFTIVNLLSSDQSGITVTAFRTSRVVTSNDIQRDERTQHVHKNIHDTAYHSSAIVPFQLRGRTIGALGLVSNEMDLFKAEEEIHLLEEMGLDISFALDTLEVEAAHKQAELQLVKSEERFRTAFDNMLEGTQIIGLDWRYLYINRSAEVHNRRPSTELLGNVYMEMWPGIEDTHVFAMIKRCLEQRIPCEIQNEFVYPDGANGLFELLIQPIPEGVLILSLDITERKRVETTRDQLARIVDASEDSILSKTLNGIITSWNHGSEQLYGYSAEEIVGKSILLIIPSDRPNELPDILTRIRHGEHVKHYETIRVRKDGTKVDISITVSPMFDNTGTIIGASTIARDITDRKKAERKLSANEAHLRAVHEALAEGIAFIDMNGTIMSKNDAVDRVLGRPLEELTDPSLDPRWRIIRSNGTLFPIEEQPAYVALRSGQPVRNVEMGVPARDGTLKWAVVNAQLVHDLILGTTLGVVVSFFDITNRKQAEEQIRNQLQHLNSLREIDTAILSSFGMKIGLDAVVSRTIIELNIDAADILVLNSASGSLEYRSGWGFDTNTIQNHIVHFGEGLAGRCAQNRQPVYIRDLRAHADQFTRKALLTEEKFIGYCCIPLIDQDEVKGVLEIFHRGPLEPKQDWLDFLHTLAGQAAIAIQSATLFSGLQHSNRELYLAYDATIAGWSRAMDLRDKETAGHTQRVTELTLELARAVGVNDDELIHIRRGALLHDMGKLGVPDDVLLKPGKLTDEEWVAMRKHPQYAYDMFSSISYLLPALDIPYCHHEKWNGTGYPRGLKGEQIPLAARLFAVVDVWDALRSDRPYRPSWPQEKVLEYIRAESGTHFDPMAVEVFLNVINEKESWHGLTLA